MNSFPLLLLGFMGLAILIRGLIYFLKLSELKKWLAVETVITQSEIKRIERPEVNVKIEYFLPEIEYSYDISGKKYSSHVISVDPKAWMENDKKKIESYLESFKKNNICYVNPKRHSDSVLTLEVSKRRLSHYYGTTIAGLVLILIFAAFYFL